MLSSLSRRSQRRVGAFVYMRRKSDGVDSGPIIRRKQDGSLEFRLGRKILATTMRTPGHDEELAAGFLVSEGIVRAPDQIKKITRADDNVVAVELIDGLKPKLSSARRFGTISTSCGICGKNSIADIRQNFPAIATAQDIRVEIETLLSLPALL